MLKGSAGTANADHDDEKHTRPTTTLSRVEVVHCFGTCAGSLRENSCLLGGARVAYSVGSRVAVTEVDGNADELTFLSTGFPVRLVNAVACSPDKRFVAVCYKGLQRPRTAYATVYHVPTKPQPSRIKTLSYERTTVKRGQPSQQGGPLNPADGDLLSLTSPVSRQATIGDNSNSNQDGGSKGGTRAQNLACPGKTAEFVAADFSQDGRLLLVLDGQPAWTILCFEWKSGQRMFTLPVGSPVHRMVFSPIDDSKIATAGDNGHFRIWAMQGGKMIPMAAIEKNREVRVIGNVDVACLRTVHNVQLSTGQEQWVERMNPATTDPVEDAQ